MAYLFYEGFEKGTPGAFTTPDVDTGGRLHFPGPRQLSADGYKIVPQRGGGVMQIDFAKSSADAYLVADTAFNVTGTATIHFRFMIMAYMLNLASSLDSFDIFRGIKTGPATEYSCKLAWDDLDGLVLDLAGNRMPFPQMVWTCIEVEVKAGASGYVRVRSGGNTLSHNPGTVADIIDFQIGVLGQAGSITQGSLVFDEIYVSPTRLYPPQGPTDVRELSGASLRMRKPGGFAFVGKGEILSVQLIGETGIDNRVNIYDTGIPTFSEDDLVEVLTATVAGMTKINQRILQFNRGAWVEPSGTDPLVVMQLGRIESIDYLGDSGIAGAGSAFGDSDDEAEMVPPVIP